VTTALCCYVDIWRRKAVQDRRLHNAISFETEAYYGAVNDM
jgi:hypothetical protein